MHILMADDPDENAENSIRLFYLWWIFILILIPNYDFYQHNTEKKRIFMLNAIESLWHGRLFQNPKRVDYPKSQ